MQFNEALRRRREAMHLSPDDLAKRLTRLGQPTSSADIQLWERGRNVPPLESPAFRGALASALQVPVEKLEKVIRANDISYETDQPGYRSQEAISAAEMIDSMPAHLRPIAVNLIRVLSESETIPLKRPVHDPWT